MYINIKEVGMYAEERQRLIVSLVRDHDRVAVAELADRFGVTTETIRRDLEALDERGLVQRVHGGAVPRASGIFAPELGLVEREARNVPQKTAIARCALAYLPPADGSVIIDAGTTTGQLVALLPEDVRLPTLVTNSVAIAALLSARDTADVLMLGGRVRGITQSVVGANAADAVGRLRVDLTLLGANGMSAQHGFSTPDLDEAMVKRAMIRAARRVVALVDSSKIGTESLHSFARLSDVDVLITDAGITDAVRAEFIEQGVEVVVA